MPQLKKHKSQPPEKIPSSNKEKKDSIGFKAKIQLAQRRDSQTHVPINHESSDQESLDSARDPFADESSFEIEEELQKPIVDEQNLQKLDKLGLTKKLKAKKKNEELEIIVNNFVENCLGSNIEQTVLDYEQVYDLEYKEKATGVTENMSIFVSQLTDIEKISLMSKEGSTGVLRSFRIFMKRGSMLCQAIVEHSIFEAFILLLIMGNSLKMALDDPLSTTTSLPVLENMFTALYTTEMTLKILAYGFLFNKGAYLRDAWNIMDFIIVCTSLMPLLITLNFSVSALRAIRVLRPLKTITKIKALKMIVRTLFLSFSLVMDSLLILFFVMIVFAIAGQQLYSGLLKMKCMQLSTGLLSNLLCESDSDCLSGSVCAKGISSPNFSIYNLDTFMWALVTVFLTITLEGWSVIMANIQMVSGFVNAIYSVLIVFFCQYVLLNMTLAILKYKYAQVKGNTIEDEEDDSEQFEPEFLRKIGVYEEISKLSAPPPLQRYLNDEKFFVGRIGNFAVKPKLNQLDDINLLSVLNEPRHSQKVVLQNEADQVLEINELKKLGLIANPHCDPKLLKFDTNEVKFAEKFLIEVKDEEGQEDAFSSSNEAELIEEFEDEEEEDIEVELELQKNIEKVSEVMKKVRPERLEVNFLKSNSAGAEERQIASPTRLVKLKVNQQVSGLDKMLQLISKEDGVRRHEKSFIPIPDVEFGKAQVEKLYKRFADIGKYKIQVSKRKNELEGLQVHKHRKINREIHRVAIKEMIEENMLDIKELHIKNQLQKRMMKCRIKESDLIDSYGKYDHRRVIVSESIKIEQKKQREIDDNIKTLAFQVRYKQSLAPQSENVFTKFTRSLETGQSLLKIPELLNFNVVTSKTKKAASKVVVFEKDNQYLRLLQNKQADEKIELTLDRVNAAFFKKVGRDVAKQAANLKEQYALAREQDILKRHGHIKLQLPIECEDAEQLIDRMNMHPQEYDIFIKGMFGMITVLRKKTLLLVSRSGYDNAMLLIVLVNTILMSINGFVNIDQYPYSTIGTICNYVFMLDLALKLIAYGISFFGDIMNIFDAMVVSITIAEITLGSSNLSALKSIRTLRAFRILRIMRLIRSLSYMRIVMSVVSSVINQFVYIFMLLALFLFIYTLLGMQIFGGTLLPQSVSGIRQNFDTFLNALLIAFQVTTVENWNDIETAIMISNGPVIASIYLVSLIFIGNWILLNLLQAILLDGFDEDSKEGQVQEETSESMSEQKQQEEDIISESTTKQTEKDSSIGSGSRNSLDNASSALGYKSLGSQKTIEAKEREIIIEEDASLFLFKRSSWVRQYSRKISQSAIFRNFIMLAILLSSIKLALDTYIPTDSSWSGLLSTFDYVFNTIFITQCLLKVISLGFFIGKNSYVDSSWNKLDLFIVIVSIIDMTLSSINLSILKLFRTLRPLRIVSKNQDMKIIITSLGQSIFGIMNVLIIILCVFLMFGILGNNLLEGKLGYCNLGPNIIQGNYGPYMNQTACASQQGTWQTQLINFQNVANSLLSLYVFSTRQNWPFYVFSFMDASENGPVKDNNQLLYFLYSVLFIFVCSYFFVDLLVGVLFMNFHEAEAKTRPKVLTDKQINWQNLQKVIIAEDACFRLYLEPTNPFRNKLFQVVTSRVFEMFITICILANIMVMIVGNDDDSASKTAELNTANTIFSLIFIVQMILKLITFDRAYFLSAWNIFDCFVSSASILDLILQITGLKSSGSSALSILPQIARIFRVMRITRLLRMFKQFKGLQKLIETFLFSLPALGRGLSILLLYLFIAAILASNLFNNIVSQYGGNLDRIRNYNDFHHSLEMLLINLTGQNWYFYMYEFSFPGYVQCTDGSSSTCTSILFFAFWIPFVFFGQKVFLELFVLIVLDQFEANYINEHNPLGIFALLEDNFREQWIEFTHKYKAEKIQAKKLIDLLMALKPPIGEGRADLMLKYEEELKENSKLTTQNLEGKLQELDLKLKKNAAKLLHKMNVMRNRIYFGYHQTFYYFAKIGIGLECLESANNHQREHFETLHKESEKALEELRPAGNLFYYEEHAEASEDKDPLNPIALILFCQMILKSWHNYSLRYHGESLSKKKKNDYQDAYDSLNASCISNIEEAEFQRIGNPKKTNKHRDGMMDNKDKPVLPIGEDLLKTIQQRYKNTRENSNRASFRYPQDPKTMQRRTNKKTQFEGSLE